MLGSLHSVQLVRKFSMNDHAWERRDEGSRDQKIILKIYLEN